MSETNNTPLSETEMEEIVERAVAPNAATASSPRPRTEGGAQPSIPKPPAPRRLTRLPVVLMVLSLFFAVSAIIAAQTYSTLGTQHQRAEQEVADAQTYLQKVKELFR